jgi:hypothetical protein
MPRLAKKKLIKLEDYELIDMWNEFIFHVASMENELFKSAKGNVSAGIRFRSASIEARKMLIEIKNRTLDADKDRQSARRDFNKENIK